MTLYNLLNYRTHCLIHSQEKLIPYFKGYDSLNTEITSNGLSLYYYNHNAKPMDQAKSILLEFNYDGSYQDLGGHPDHMVSMECSICRAVKGRSYGKSIFGESSTLMDLRKTLYGYNFLLKTEKQTSFQGSLIGEIVRYPQKERFYHLDQNLKTGETSLKMGDCGNNIIFDDLLKDMITIKLPNFNLQQFENINQLIDRMKILATFS
jgi:hypothetical protein